MPAHPSPLREQIHELSRRHNPHAGIRTEIQQLCVSSITLSTGISLALGFAYLRHRLVHIAGDPLFRVPSGALSDAVHQFKASRALG